MEPSTNTGGENMSWQERRDYHSSSNWDRMGAKKVYDLDNERDACLMQEAREVVQEIKERGNLK